MINKRKKPKWPVEGRYLKRIKNRWRKPRGRHSKLRQHIKGKGIMPSIGFGNPRQVRGLHPSGFKEVLVHNFKQLASIDPKKEAVRFSKKIGSRKRKEMIKKTEELKLKVLNP